MLIIDATEFNDRILPAIKKLPFEVIQKAVFKVRVINPEYISQKILR